jgi:acyl-CoA synthetase (NDP forming)
VVLSVRAGGFEAAVDEALAAGAKAIVGISAGLGELDEAGRDLEAAVTERVRAAGAVLLGPNCLGVFDADAELDLGWSALPAGEIALVSQSGNLALELARLAASAGLGFSRFVSLGNQADLVAADLLDDLAAHARTRVIALYLEDFRDGRSFVEAAARARAAGTPIVVLPGGTTGSSARAALSHTGALVSDSRAIDAACAAAGIVRVATPTQLIDAAQALLAGRLLRGRRVAVYADGGGHGVVASDVLAAAGLDVPALSPSTTAALKDLLPTTASLANPVDFAGGGERGLTAYADVGRVLLRSSDVDAVLLTGYFGGYGADTPELADEEVATAQALAAAAAENDAVLVVQTSYPESAAAGELRLGGVAVYGDVASAAAMLGMLASLAEGEPMAPAPGDLPDLEAPRPGYWAARAFLAEAGVTMTDARPAGTVEEARAIASELGYPVVLKAGELTHKSDTGGVVLGLEDAEQLAAAFAALFQRLGQQSFSVERMVATEGVELIVGAKRDPRFGAIVLVGLGGVYAEILDDVTVALAPVDDSTAERLIRALRGAPLLDGARGRSRLDIAAAAQAVAAMSRAAAACPEILEIEVNPLFVAESGAVGLDARIVLA